MILKNRNGLGWFHLKQDLIRNARTLGLSNKKNKDIDINNAYDIITTDFNTIRI